MNDSIAAIFEVSTADDGMVEAIYIRFSSEKVFRTEEIEENTLLRDFDKSNGLIGIEVLAPVKIAKVARLMPSASRLKFKRYLRRHPVPELVSA